MPVVLVQNRFPNPSVNNACPYSPSVVGNTYPSNALIVSDLGSDIGFVSNTTFGPAINCMRSSPSATNVSWPATSQYLNVLFIPILTLPDPRSVTSNPESESNLKPITLVTVLAYELSMLIRLMVSEDPLPV